jgi:hypothetical protein
VERVGELQQMGSKANALPHTMEKHQRSGLRWTTNIIPHLVRDCQHTPQRVVEWVVQRGEENRVGYWGEWEVEVILWH